MRWRDVPFVFAAVTVAVVFASMFGASAQTGALTIISGPSASSITETSATISWATDTESTTVVLFGETSSLGQSYRKIVPLEETEITETNHSMTLWELKKGTTYYYKARSVAEGGATAESAVATFKTAGTAFDGVPLEGAAIVLPKHGSTLLDAVHFVADVVGEATAVTFTLGGGPLTAPQQASATKVSSARWEYVATGTLKPGTYTLYASATGKDKDGGFVVKQTPSVTFTFAAPVVAEAPEPAATAEPSDAATPSETTTTPETAASSSPEQPPTTTTAESTNQPPSEAAAAYAGAGETQPTEPAPDLAAPQPVSAQETAPAQTSADAAADAEVAAKAFETGFIDVPGGDLVYRADRDGNGKEDVEYRYSFAQIVAKFGIDECAEQGIETRERCIRVLDAQEGGFPGCEGKSAEECERVKRLAVLGYLPEAAKAQIDTRLSAALDAGSVPEFFGLGAAARDDARPRISLAPSLAPAGRENSPAVLFLDADRDGVSDDVEVIAGSDPTKGDSDADGLSDRDEARNGFHPVTGLPLAESVDPTAAAVLSRLPLEQPRGAGGEDASFSVRIGGQPDAPTLDAACEPGATCLFYVYSYVPIVLAAKADAAGGVRYELSDVLGEGEHAAYVVVTDETGKIRKRSSPLSFFIKEARAVSEEEFLQPQIIEITEPIESYKRFYLAGAMALMAVGGMLAFAVMRRRRVMQ